MMPRSVVLYDDIYRLPDNLADKADGVRIPMDEHPGWRPPTLKELLEVTGGTVIDKALGSRRRRNKADQIAALKRRRGRFYRRNRKR